MQLSVDYREYKVIELLNNDNDKITNYKVENLMIGDFIIKNDDIIHFVIERKSIDDLVSSIKDGRFREQKQRLIDSIGNPDKIVYILEGNKNNKYSLPTSTINSAIMNLLFKHNYKVIFTENQEDTLSNILLLYKKVKDKVFECSIEPINQIKLIKKKDSINNDIFINMLSVIPGVSILIARKINQEYKSLSNLINKFTEPELLSDLNITDKRKLGKALSKKIHTAFFELKENLS